MAVNAEIFQQIQQEASKGESSVFYCKGVMKLHDRGGKDQRILVITNINISFCKYKSHPTFDRIMYWPYVTSFCVQDNSFNFLFGQDPFRFETEDVDEILEIIIPILQHVLTKNEYKALNLAYPYCNCHYSNPIGFYSRFVAFNKKADIKPNNDLHDVIVHTAKFKPNIIDIPQSASKIPSIAPVFAALDLSPYVESIILPQFTSFDVFRAVKDYLLTAPYLQHVLFTQANPRSFSDFCTTLLNSQTINLTGLSFKSTPFRKDHLEKLKELIYQKQLNSLSLQNSVDKSALDYFYKMFFDSKTESLKMLNFDRTPILKYDKLLNFVSNITHLSFASCKIDIYNFFKVLNRSNANNLKMLNLSVNECHSPVSTNMEFPPNLTRLDINVIKWDQGCIQPFVQAILNNDWKHGLTLGFADEVTNDTDWTELFNIMENSGVNSIAHLLWSYNRVSPAFFRFLGSKCEHLHSLTIVGCLSEKMTEEVEAFVRALTKMPMLSKLIITGKENVSLGSKIQDILGSLLKRGNIRVLDVSSNKLSDDDVFKLADFIKKCPSLTDISFDDSIISSPAPIDAIISAAEGRPTPLYISWPRIDFSRLSRNGRVHSDELFRYNKLFLGIAKEDDFPERKSYFAQPFESHLIDPHIRYPLYIYKETEDLNTNTKNNVIENIEENYESSGFLAQAENDSSSPFISSHGKKDDSSGFDLWVESSSDGLTNQPILQIQPRTGVPPAALDNLDSGSADAGIRIESPSRPERRVGFDLKSSSLAQFIESSDAPTLNEIKPRSKSLPSSVSPLDTFKEDSDKLGMFMESESSGPEKVTPQPQLPIERIRPMIPKPEKISSLTPAPLAKQKLAIFAESSDGEMFPPQQPSLQIQPRNKPPKSIQAGQRMSLAEFIDSSSSSRNDGASNWEMSTDSLEEPAIDYRRSPILAPQKRKTDMDSGSFSSHREEPAALSREPSRPLLLRRSRLFSLSRSMEAFPCMTIIRQRPEAESKKEKLTLEQFMEEPKVIKAKQLPLDIFAEYPDGLGNADRAGQSEATSRRYSSVYDVGALISLDRYHSVNSVSEMSDDDDDEARRRRGSIPRPIVLPQTPQAGRPQRPSSASKARINKYASADLTSLLVKARTSPGFDSLGAGVEYVTASDESLVSEGEHPQRIEDESSGQYSQSSGEEVRVPEAAMEALRADAPILVSLALGCGDREGEAGAEVGNEAQNEEAGKEKFIQPVVFPDFGQNTHVYQPPPSWLGDDILNSESASLSESQSLSQSLSQSIGASPLQPPGQPQPGSLGRPVYPPGSSSSLELDSSRPGREVRIAPVSVSMSEEPAEALSKSQPVFQKSNSEFALESELSSASQMGLDAIDSAADSEASVSMEESEARRRRRVRVRAPGSLVPSSTKRSTPQAPKTLRPRAVQLAADRARERERETGVPDWAFPLSAITRPHSNKYVAAIQAKFSFEFLIQNLRK